LRENILLEVSVISESLIASEISGVSENIENSVRMGELGLIMDPLSYSVYWSCQI